MTGWAIALTCLGGAMELYGFVLVAAQAEALRQRMYPEAPGLLARLWYRLLRLLRLRKPAITTKSDAYSLYWPIPSAEEVALPVEWPSGERDQIAWLRHRVERMNERATEEAERVRHSMEQIQDILLGRIGRLEERSSREEYVADMANAASAEMRGALIFSVGVILNVAGAVLSAASS